MHETIIAVSMPYQTSADHDSDHHALDSRARQYPSGPRQATPRKTVIKNSTRLRQFLYVVSLDLEITPVTGRSGEYDFIARLNK